MTTKIPAKNHSPRFLKLATESRKNIQEISPLTLKNKLKKSQDFVLIDVREDQEWSSGHIPTAIHLNKGIIERDIEKKIPDATTSIVVYCSGGFRGALVAENLKRMGYTDVLSLKDGSRSWTNLGFPITK